MNKLSVTIVDHHDHSRSINRRSFLRSKIAPMGYLVRDFPFVWGDEPENPDCSPEGFVVVGDVNLVHSNNECAGAFIKYVFEQFPNAWVIEYSGDGIRGMGYREPENSKHCLYPESVSLSTGLQSLPPFLEAVARGEVSARNILLGFDPLLEAKLELLHLCLTPAGARIVVDAADRITARTREASDEELPTEIGLMLSALERDGIQLSSTEVEASVENGRKIFTGSLASAISELAKPDRDCFSPEYVAILSEIRNSLLPNPNLHQD